MSGVTKAVVTAGAGLVAAGGVALWARWLLRRQKRWGRILSDNIPVHSAYWRARREKPGDLLYVAVGDSAAQGIGASRPARSYVGVLAKRIAARSGLSVRVVNLGISGGTLETALEKELPRLARLKPDVLTVAIGANDIADWDAARFSLQLEKLLAALPAHAIVADLPSFYFLPGERAVVKANRILRTTARRHGLTVVDLHAAMKRAGLWGMATQFAGDLFHPNDRGYVVWADAFTPAVEARLEVVLEQRAPRGQSASGSADSSPRSQSRASTNTESA